MEKKLALVLKPLDGFSEWVNAVASQGMPQTLTPEQSNTASIDINFLSYGSPVVIVPWIEDSRQYTHFLDEHADIILTAAFHRWCHNRELWPPLDLNTMLNLFGYDVYTRIVDLQHTKHHHKETPRHAVTVVIKDIEAIKEWFKTAFIKLHEPVENIEKVDLDSFVKNAAIYLLPETINDFNGALNYFQTEYRTFFETELKQFTSEKMLWPEERSFNLFTQWFAIEFHSTVLTLK